MLLVLWCCLVPALMTPRWQMRFWTFVAPGSSIRKPMRIEFPIVDDEDIASFTSQDPIVKHGIDHYEHYVMLHLAVRH
jgi:hypothetical protein